MYNADRAVGSFCERHKDDLFTDKFRWTKADTADLASFGLSSLTCFISGKSLAKDLDDFMAASTDLATLGSSVGCFVAGTTVKTEEGDKAIEEIKAGDKVLSYEATTGRFAYKEVVEVIAHDGVTELAHITIGGETIDSTTNHPYFVVGYGYVDAGNLIEGDTVLLANGEEGKVEKVEIEFLTEPVTVYNFEVKDWHCYFVGEAGVLVHNDVNCVTGGTTSVAGVSRDSRVGIESGNKSNSNNKVFTKKVKWTATHTKGTGQTYEVHQRNDIDWEMTRTAGDHRFIGKTNAEAAQHGLAPQLNDGNFATLHHLGQDSRGGLVEASTRYHGVGKYGQDILHSQFGRSKPNPSHPINRKQFSYDTKEYWSWRELNR